MSLTLLEREKDHPQTVVCDRGGRRIVYMYSAMIVDERNSGTDVVLPPCTSASSSA